MLQKASKSSSWFSISSRWLSSYSTFYSITLFITSFSG